ncbi:MAG: FAD-binding protein [Lachnospiraceae bacterium]|nr:FAD-binding protein [Lachnospiraceae bacterium]
MNYSEYSTQLLIVGGALSGISAALTAKKIYKDLDILVADKCDASYGYSGKSSRTAGLLSFVTHEDDPEAFVEFHTREIGTYLNDQDLLREYANSSDTVLRSLKEWGVEILEDENGYPDYLKWPFPWGTASIDPDASVSMANTAKKMGIRYLERVVIYRLLTSCCGVAGAIGFSLNTGELVVIHANAVILACGSQNYDITKAWAATGNGIAMAFNAGAKMRNCEYGNMCDFARVGEDGTVEYAAAHTAHDHLYVGDKNISQYYRPGMHSSMDPVAAYAWYKETMKGNLVEADIGEFQQAEGNSFFKFHPKAMFRRDWEHTPQFPKADRFPVIPGFIGELSCVYTDHRMQTSIPGLFAVGDTSGGGTARAGAVATPPGKIHGTGIYNAVFTGIEGGRGASAVASKLPIPTVEFDPNTIELLSANIFAPLNRKEGIHVREMIHEIQDIIMPTDYSLVKSGDRIQEALDKINAMLIKLPEVYVNNLHELAKYVDLLSMILGAKLFYTASLERKESRGFHLREDYPYTDNENFLKWIIIQKGENGRFDISFEDIPMDRYLYKPREKRSQVFVDVPIK